MNRGFNVLTPLAPEDLVFCALTGDEELSRLFDFHLELRSPRPDLDFDALIGQSFTVEIDLPDGESRYLNGQCAHFAATGKSGRWYHYEAQLRPWLWYATRRSDCKIFQHLSAPQIVKEVLARYPYPIKDKLSGQYREWDYCVQYRESDFNFVSRLMEHEGIYYYFEHSEGEHALVLCDDTSPLLPFPGYETIPFWGPDNGQSDDEHFETWLISRTVDTGAFVAQDYNFEKPFADLTTTRAIDRKHAQAGHEAFDYPGGYTHPDDGERYAKVRIQQMHSEHEVALATGPVRGAAPGNLFTLAYHPREDQNREYQITQVSYVLIGNSYEADGSSNSHSCQFRIKALPTTETYRPRSETPKPRTMGPETALVVGPRGEEIYTDQYGRVKVQFPWDRYGKKNESSSCWIRVASSWAGTGFGMVQVPRIGQEVIVDYLGGDPDRPVITGSVFNAEQMPPWRLPGAMTQSGILSRSLDKSDRECANALRFEDKKGEEELWLHAERDQRIEVENDESHSVGGNRSITVGGAHSETIKKNATLTVSEGDHCTTVSQGVQTNTVSQGTHTNTVKGDITVESQSGKYTLTAATEITLKVGGSSIVMAPGHITLKSAKIDLNP
jgi:type VI secretion system secreted protein VgrG